MGSDGHIPVLMASCLELLAPKPGDVYVDCTAGMGGHGAAVGAVVGGGGVVVLNDADPTKLDVAADRVRATGAAVHVVRGNFAEVPNKLPGMGLKADCVLADLGFSSVQVDDPARGFSFSQDGPLDMRMDPSLPMSAADLVNSWPESEIAAVIDRYGEDRNARRIASKLVWGRQSGPILTTGRLAELVRAASRGGTGQIDPATRTFQAIRIAVNDEIGSLEALLGAVIRDAARLAKGHEGAWLKPGARVGVISFHSLEDREVKKAFAEVVGLGGVDVSGGARAASEDEVRENVRARSAKLRVVRMAG